MRGRCIQDLVEERPQRQSAQLRQQQVLVRLRVGVGQHPLAPGRATRNRPWGSRQ